MSKVGFFIFILRMSVVELYKNAIKWHDDVWLRVMTEVLDKEAAIALLVGLDTYGMLIFEVWRPLFLEVFGINERDGKGRKHGLWRDWWSPGIVLRTECHFHEGKARDGGYVHYDEAGELVVRGFLRNCKREGYWKEWDYEDRCMLNGKYANGFKVGPWVIIDRKSGKYIKPYAAYAGPRITRPTPIPYSLPSTTRTHAGFAPTSDLPLPHRLSGAKATSYKSGGATWFYLLVRAHATNSRH